MHNTINEFTSHRIVQNVSFLMTLIISLLELNNPIVPYAFNRNEETQLIFSSEKLAFWDMTSLDLMTDITLWVPA